MSYTFGDNQEASRRLRRLAEVYEPETRELLQAVGTVSGGLRFKLALDLGCGPGWSTKLIGETLAPQRTVGLDASASYIAEARTNQPQLEFLQHDVLTTRFPVQNADFLFCRFLLTHVASPRAALECWSDAAGPGALLAIHETESLDAEHPALRRYYEMVGQMQKHHGQELHVGALLDAALAQTSWTVVHSQRVILEKSSRDMAGLHVANLRTWGKNDFALATFGRREMDQLEAELAAIASSSQTAGVVRNDARQIIARRT